MLCFPPQGIVYGFNVTAPKDVEKLSKRLEVPLKSYKVIYKLMDDIKVIIFIVIHVVRESVQHQDESWLK